MFCVCRNSLNQKLDVMGRRKLSFVLPRLNDRKGDLKAAWYIEYSIRNENTDKLERFKIYEGFSILLTAKEKYSHAKTIIDTITQKIVSGWTPFDVSVVEIDNQLMYYNQTKVFSNRERTEKNLFYYVNLFLEPKLLQLSEKSVLDYKSKMRLFFQWLESIGRKEIFPCEVTHEIISDYIIYLIETRKLEKRTILKSKQHIRQFFDFLVNEKIIEVNPCFNLPDARQKEDHSAQPMAQYEASHLLEYIKSQDKQLYLFCAMIFYCAIRPGKELRLLKIKDINFFTGNICIREENAKVNLGFVTMPAKLIEILIEMNVSINNREYYLFGKEGKPGTEPWGKNHFRVEFNKHRDAIGFPKEYKLYSWKCTGGILFSMSGAPLAAVRDHFRHKSTAYTDIYLTKKMGKQNDYVKHKFPEL